MSEKIIVKPVKTKKERKQFVMLPWKIYKDYPCWVPQLIMDQKALIDPQKKPYYDNCDLALFLAYRGDEVVGRIGAIVNYIHQDVYKEKTGHFGFFESIDNKEVARALFAAAAEWHKSKGRDRMRGPVNPSVWDTNGLLINAFDSPPVILTPYNPPYYVELLKAIPGLKKARDWYAYYIDKTIPFDPKVERITNIVKKRHNITIRKANLKKLKRELELIKIIFNDAWHKNWEFLPLNDREIDFLCKEIKPIVVEDLVLFAFVNGDPAGFTLSIPDFNQALKHINGRLLPFGIFKLLKYRKKIDAIRVFAMGMREKYRNMGIDAVFYHETYKRGVKLGYGQAEMSLIVEDNTPMTGTLEHIGAKRYKTYRMYDKDFT